MSGQRRVSPLSLIRDKLRRRAVVGVGATLVVLGLSIAAMLWVQTNSDRQHRAVESLSTVRFETAVLGRLEWQANAEGEASGELAEQIQYAAARARAALARTIGELGRRDGTQAIDRLLTTYLSLTATEFSLLAQGRFGAATQVGTERLEPTFERLQSQIATEQARARDAARRVEMRAKVEGIALLLLALIAISALFWRLASAQQAAQDAFFDPLTGLANRMLVMDRLTQALRQAERRGGRAAVLFLDLDDFKRINDTLGHAAGDALLRAVAQRLRTAVRVTDTVGRFGGDEFAIVLQGDVDEVGPPAAVARVVDELAAPFTVAGHQVTVTASIGLAVSDTGGATPAELVRSADLAMYVGKGQGKGRLVTYEPSMHEALADRLELETDLGDALARNEITVVYQPIVDVATGKPRSLEALARWAHPARGAIGPALFIPLAEEARVIQEIGRFVLLQATQQLRRWQTDHGFSPPIGVNVNVSLSQLQEGRVVEDVRYALRQSGIDPRLLTLEVTESVLVGRGDDVVSTLDQLAGLGVRLAVDDFGTGYSSLSGLSRFPIDTLKIDRSFIESMDDGEGGLELVRSIVELGGRLGLDVIAEGIETAAQADAVRQLHCAYGQGFHYARPLAADAVAGYLAAQSLPSTPSTRAAGS
jgi:diguanylate cyclase (GGDEF)-like protein